MTDHPLSLPAWAVRAIRDGRKTRHSVIMTPGSTLFNGGPWSALHKAQEWDWAGAWVDEGPSPAGNAGPYLKLPWARGYEADTFAGTVHRIYPRWQIGDRLWVRETFRFDQEWDGFTPREFDQTDAIMYAVDLIRRPGVSGGTFVPGQLRPSVHMPRWASRITLTVTGVTVQRVQDITEAEAVAEEGSTVLGPRFFMWDLTHGHGAWERNDWVAAATFTARMGNIDEGGE